MKLHENIAQPGMIHYSLHYNSMLWKPSNILLYILFYLIIGILLIKKSPLLFHISIFLYSQSTKS